MAVIVCVMLLCLSALVYGDTNTTCEIGGVAKYEYYMLVMQSTAELDPYYPVCSKHVWTLHGLWPTMKKEISPNFCGSQGTCYDSTAMVSVIDEMEQYWPTLRPKTSTNEEFWVHEWCKHGTCAKAEPSMDSQTKFFSTVLKLYKQYNITALLATNDLYPSDTMGYKFDDVQNAFVNAYGALPILECDYSKSKSRQMLSQVRVCLDMSMEPTDCDPSNVSRGCWTNEPIYYVPCTH